MSDSSASTSITLKDSFFPPDRYRHYVKKSGASAAKVFKWKELTLGPGEAIELRRTQVIKDFTTRRHYPGRHVVDLLVNGDKLASASFDLRSA